ncbi:SH3 domain-containing protein [Pedobacter fastidiosus]|uniref:SH3 domain-containing protein n=1 Tax=Pedobacter fastidiosus TaxID=2765361 RepID=A0ABR7KXP6_9SPHI|nr:SH3 domain-containing protein [Pedobacter fastidiosus]MBC6112887.1 hypothetical protein [Pedobacter fastidiosus]
MTTFKILIAYKRQYENPIILNVGDVVDLGEEEKEDKWLGWIWAEFKNNQGWIPIQILEIANDRKTGRVLEYYSANELDVGQGDVIEKIKSVDGWSWSRKIINNEEGWIPDEVIG